MKAEKKETFSERMSRERYELLDAVEAAVLFHKALDRFDNCAYKGDALAELEKRRADWYEKLELVKPYLKERM